MGLGLTSLLAVVPGLEAALRFAGVAFLLYLSVRLFRDDGQLPEDDNRQAPGFMTGALMQWLNPKAWLAAASGIGAYTGGDMGQLWLFTGLYLPICWLSLGSWVYAGAFLRRHVQRPRVLVAINRSLALLLAASAIYLVIG